MDATRLSRQTPTLSSADIEAAAVALSGAYRTLVPVEPLTETFPKLTVEDAYDIQSAQVKAWLADGRRIRGYKVGLTSRAMQEQLGVDQPDYGFLLDDMFHPDRGVLDVGRFLAPRVEPEIAFYLGQDLRGPGLTVLDVADAVESVVGALEIIDSRIRDWRITLPDTIADNASSAGVVVGEQRVPLADIDVVGSGATLSRNGHIVGAGTGEAVLGSPLKAVAWLANRLGELGVTLEAGALVLPGSVCGAVPVARGDVVIADFDVLGAVQVAFAQKE